ncbi:EAL domain-containing protein [Beggiatoa alba]|nr:EAL domain-containing protein [Beggiatoa alba]
MRNKLPSIKYLFSGVAIVTISLLIIMSYISYSGNRLASRHVHQVYAAANIKLNATLGHLWFEEILAGDPNEKIEKVWNYLNKADAYALALLRGGQDEAGGEIVPLSDIKMRLGIQSVRAALKQFRLLGETRYKDFYTSRPGSDIDQDFDNVFSNFINEANQVESQLQVTISRELTRFRLVSLILLGLSALVSIIVAYILFRLEKQRDSHISTIQQAHTKLNFLAHFDTLTQLPNRTLFMDRLKQSLIHAKRNSNYTVLLFIDLDKFKAVNDRHGHSAGDQLLHYAAERLGKNVRSEDTVARLGGDEFTVILSHIQTNDRAVNIAKTVANKILNEMADPFHLKRCTAFVTASIGIAVFPQDGHSADELLNNADRAMFEAKDKGKNNFQFHSDELNARAKKLLDIENELREAIEKNQLTLYYQPKWNLQNMQLSGMEVLLRWFHPRDGLVLPGEFIQIAESSDLINLLDDWVLQSACRQYQIWEDEGLNPGQISVNISPKQFRRTDLTQTISDIIAKSGFNAANLELEITESALMEDTKQTQHILKQLKKQDIQIAIDDFGTGYSSMAYLRNFPADTLKIDRSFIHAIHEDKAADAILKHMVGLAKSLEMNIVAEGIETEVQESYIRSLGCKFGQGFKLAKPMPADDYRLLMIAEAEPNICTLFTN